MFEVLRNDKRPSYLPDTKYLLFHDGELLERITVEADDNDHKGFYKIETSHNYETKYILGFTLNDFVHFASRIILRNANFIEGFNWRIEIMPQIKTSEILFNLAPNLEFWNYPYSFSEYKESFLEIFNKLNRFNFYSYYNYNLVNSSSLSLRAEHDFKNKSFFEELDKFKDLLIEVHVKVADLLTKNSKLYFYFNFPNDVKAFCEQYLLYFVKFLQDLGISATSDLKEEAEKVLFSVTPTDDVEALDKIREALAVYLNLPSSPVVYDESIPSMRLKQQIDNLQHALKMSEMEYRLAQRVIESQDKIIQQKDSTIEQQSKILEKLTDKAVMINSAENKEELEELFEGVKIGKSKFLAEQGGLHLNPLTALKSVGKKITGKDSEIISLNLNEENDL